MYNQFDGPGKNLITGMRLNATSDIIAFIYGLYFDGNLWQWTASLA